jgi:copper(I)-binding protein
VSAGPAAGVLVALGLALAAEVAGAQVTLANAWLRPAAAGQKEAQVYVDIRAGEALTLVGARSPIARRAELVLLDPPHADGTLRVVGEIAVPANQETRLAFRGSHIRLVDVIRTARPNEHVGLELTFVDAAGKRKVVTTDALVRGVVVRRPDGSEAPAAN